MQAVSSIVRNQPCVPLVVAKGTTSPRAGKRQVNKERCLDEMFCTCSPFIENHLSSIFFYHFKTSSPIQVSDISAATTLSLVWISLVTFRDFFFWSSSQGRGVRERIVYNKINLDSLIGKHSGIGVSPPGLFNYQAQWDSRAVKSKMELLKLISKAALSKESISKIS